MSKAVETSREALLEVAAKLSADIEDKICKMGRGEIRFMPSDLTNLVVAHLQSWQARLSPEAIPELPKGEGKWSHGSSKETDWRRAAADHFIKVYDLDDDDDERTQGLIAGFAEIINWYMEDVAEAKLTPSAIERLARRIADEFRVNQFTADIVAILREELGVNL